MPSVVSCNVREPATEVPRPCKTVFPAGAGAGSRCEQARRAWPALTGKFRYRLVNPGGAGCGAPGEKSPATSTASKRQARLQNSQRTSTSPRSFEQRLHLVAAERLQDPGDPLARAGALEEDRRALEQADVVLAETGDAAARGTAGRRVPSASPSRRAGRAAATRRPPPRARKLAAGIAHRDALQQEPRGAVRRRGEHEPRRQLLGALEVLLEAVREPRLSRAARRPGSVRRLPYCSIVTASWPSPKSPSAGAASGGSVVVARDAADARGGACTGRASAAPAPALRTAATAGPRT